MSYPPLYISIFFMLLAAVLAITHLQASLPELIISLLFWSGLFSIGLYCGWQNAKQQRPVFEQIGNGIAIIAILVFTATFFARGLTFALIGFLVWIQAARNFTLSTPRDFYFAITLSFFLLLYAASQSKSGIFLLFMVAYVLAGTFALVANYLETRRQQAQNQPDMLVLKTRTFLADGIGLATMILFVATLLYLLVPRPPATHFGAFMTGGIHYYEDKEWQAEAQDNDVGANEESDKLGDSQENRLDNDEEGNFQGETLSEGTSPFSNQFFNRDIFAYEGFQKSCDIQKPKQSRQSNDIVLYLQAEQPLYLRGEVFDTFNNHNWTKHFSDDKKLALEYDEISFGDEMNNDGVSQIITLNKNMSSGTIFAAETVKMLRFPASVIARNHYGTLQAPSPLRKGTVYSVKSYFETIKDHPASGAESLDDPGPYLQLPQTLSPRIPALAQTMTQHATTDLVRALAIETHLRDHYTYTFKTVLASPGKMLLEEFLFETRHGHCELFATAMVILLRTQHIPARLATGFSATNLNPLTGYYEIRALDAHAWVEGYFPEYGWVLFEPTAYYNLPTSKQATTTAEALVEYLENMAEAAEVIAPNADSTTWLNALLGAIHQIKAWLFISWKWMSNVFTELWYFFARFGIYLILATLLLGLIFVYGRHIILTRLSQWRLQRAIKGDPRHFVLRCYQELERFFTRCGYPRHAGWTANEYAEILTKDHANLSQPIHAITESFIQVRYSCHIPNQTELQHRYADFQKIRQFNGEWLIKNGE